MTLFKQLWHVTKTALQDFFADDAIDLAAGVAFYTALSFAPLLTLLISIGAWLGPETQSRLIEEVRQVIGEAAAGVVDTVVRNAEGQGGAGSVAFWLSLAVTVFSASGVFAQLQKSLNRVWNVEAKPGQGIWGWVRTRLLSIGTVAGLIFILLVSLIVSTAIGYILPDAEGWGRLGSVAVSLAVYIPLFMLLFSLLPDVQIAKRDVVFGSVVTAALFLIGRTLIGLYLGHSAVGSAYGAAGSLVVLLVWVYYSSIILLLGAEITQARARLYGAGIHPDEHAVRVGRRAKAASHPVPDPG